MKKLFTLFAAALVMLAAASCEKNEVLPGGTTEGKVITLKASINNGETKTSLGEKEGDTYPTLWTEGDAIAVINNGKMFKFEYKGTEAVSVAEFTMADDQPAGTSPEDFKASLEIKAFYPYEGITYNDGTIKYNVPATQTYTTTVIGETVYSTFGNGTSPMAADRGAGNSGALSFQNLFGVLKLQLKGAVDEKVKSIVITSDDPLNGMAQHVYENLTLQEDSEENKKLTLDCGGEGVALNTATDFLICVPQGEHNFTITVNSTIGDTPKTYNLTTTQAIEAGVIKKMAVMDFNIAYIDENGIYRGDGIALPAEEKTIIWAPVNCGYDATGYPYGKLYQWGRKDGQGYSSNDASVATIFSEEVPSILDANTFYELWNPDYTKWPNETDPCPQGWRVPTSDELMSLVYELNSEGGPSIEINSSQWGDNGLWCYGDIQNPTSSNSKVFFQAAGSYLNGELFNFTGRGHGGTYWSSSKSDNNCAKNFSFSYLWGDLNVGLFNESPKANGYSVRCVKE